MLIATLRSWATRAWQRMKAVQQAIAIAVTVFLLFIVYFTVFAAVAIVARLLGKDLLHPKSPIAGSYWLPRAPVESAIKDLTRQF